MPSKKDIEAGRAYVRIFLKNDMRAQLAKALRAAGGALKRFGRRAVIIGGSVVAAGTAIAGALTLAANKFAAFGDNLHKMALRTGASTEFLSEMKFAAEQSGASIEGLGDVLQKMNRRFGRVTAGHGSQTQIKAVEELGLSVEKLRSLNPEDRFLAFADAMANYGDQAAAAGLAQRLFGTGIDKLLPLIWEGKDGIEALRREARDLGLTMSQDDANAAASYTDAMNRLKRSLEAVWIRIGAAVAPALTDLANRMAQNVAKVVNWINTNKDLIANAMRVETAIASLKVAWAEMVLFWKTQSETFEDWFAGFTEGLAGLMIEAVATMKNAFYDLIHSIQSNTWFKTLVQVALPGPSGQLAAGGATLPSTADVEAEREAAWKALRENMARAFKDRKSGPSGVGQAEKDLAEALRKLKELLAKPRAPGAAPGVLGSPISGGLGALSAAGRGSPVLTATYSAAAARIGGYQGGPEKKMAEGIDKVAQNTKEMTMLQQQFLAGWRIA